uniref:Uncharacterized protein n=1 Tax=Lactuca sativa TaxID=4236 RepID=A0A9R1VM29_LACSA|nr:hypothetical protein LSAT_V11C500241660 [Lactuca sativa]
MSKSGSLGEAICGTHDVLTEALGTEEQTGHVRGIDENIQVMIEIPLLGESLLLIPLEEEFIVKVKDALGHILCWPRHLVIRCSDLGRVVAKPMKKYATPVKEEPCD